MADSDSIDVVLCACGCGQPAAIPTYTKRKGGYIKGVPRRFAIGHHGRGVPRRRKEIVQTYRTTALYGNRKRLHVAIAETALGHALPADAEVHHVDGVKWNNAHTNLVICQDHAYHMLLHARARVQKAGGDPNTQRICCHCKQLWPTEKLYGGNQCSRCMSAKSLAKRRARGDLRPKGESHGMAKLSLAIVRDIKSRSWPRGALVKLAKELGVTPDALYSVRRGRNWKSA